MTSHSCPSVEDTQLRDSATALHTVRVVGALPESLMNFRGDLLASLKKRGADVCAMAAPAASETIANLAGLDVRFEEFPIVRTGRNPFEDINCYFALRRSFRRARPDAVLAYTIKPVIYSGLALRSLKHTRFVAMITGLGYAFRSTKKASWLSSIASRLYQLALSRASVVIFQNHDDRDFFVTRKLVPKAKTFIVNGSGINTKRFAASPIPDGVPVFLLIARLLRAKGILEFLAAAARIKQTGHPARFVLLGPTDPSPDGISLEVIHQAVEQGHVEYVGEHADVRPFIRDCHVYVLPSYHEGMPRTVLEAMAVGRPIITTDAPGCRETVAEGVNGKLIQPGSTEELVDAVYWFLNNREAWEAMGQASRIMAETKFEVSHVNQQILSVLLPE